MTPVEVAPFLQTKLLEDLGAVANGGQLYLLTVEHTYEMVNGSAEPAEKTEWRVWAPATEGGRFSQASPWVSGGQVPSFNPPSTRRSQVVRRASSGPRMRTRTPGRPGRRTTRSAIAAWNRSG